MIAYIVSQVLGCLAMIDDEETDWKVICIAADDPLATQLNDVRVCPFLYMSADLVGSAGAVLNHALSWMCCRCLMSSVCCPGTSLS